MGFGARLTSGGSRTSAVFFFAAVVGFMVGCAAPPLEKLEEAELHEFQRHDPKGSALDSFDRVYIREGAELSRFQVRDIAPCEVRFRSGWRERQKASRLPLAHRLSPEDVEMIRDEVAARCNRTFKELLSALSGHAQQASEPPNVGELVFTPRLIDLQIAAPEVRPVGVLRTYTMDSSQVTLVLQGHDAHTGELLIEVTDRRRDPRATNLEWTNRVTNQRDMQWQLNALAKPLTEGLAALLSTSQTID